MILRFNTYLKREIKRSNCNNISNIFLSNWKFYWMKNSVTLKWIIMSLRVVAALCISILSRKYRHTWDIRKLKSDDVWIFKVESEYSYVYKVIILQAVKQSVLLKLFCFPETPIIQCSVNLNLLPKAQCRLKHLCVLFLVGWFCC